MDVTLTGEIRGVFPDDMPEGADRPLALNTRREGIVAQGLPELTEIVRLGQTWQAQVATGIAALTARPTTTAGLSLWNGEAATGKIYVIEAFGSSEEVIDATQTDVTGLYACMNVGQTVTKPTAAAITIRGTTGRVYDGSAILATSATITNDGWFPHGTDGAQMAAVAAGANFKVNEARVRGLYQVRPGGMFNIVCVKAAAAAAAQQFYFIRWHEAQLKYRT